MSKTYSIAEARNNFAAIVHDLETTSSIQVTRRGKPVAMLLSMEEFARLSGGGQGFWERYLAFCRIMDPGRYMIEPEFLDGVRDSDPGREMQW